MKKMFNICLIAVFLLSMSAFAVAGDDDKYTLGNKVSDFSLKDINGTEHSLEGFLKDKTTKGVVFVFVSKNCPVSNACDARYKEMAPAFKEKGILFVGINSNKTESVEDIRMASDEREYNFPILKDWDNVIADRFGAEFTPHAYFIGSDGVLLYKGRIDDNHRNASKVQENTLSMVVDEYLSGKKLSYSETKSNGCTIKRVNK
ncbi:redoxin domain-containing protein [candidate division KSB1 bacterium]